MAHRTTLLLPANEVCEGYVFTPVCHSVHGGGSVCLSACWDTPPPGSRHPSWSIHPHLGADTPPCAVHAGRYGQQAGGMHPTVMHTFLFKASCLTKVLGIFGYGGLERQFCAI